MLADEDQDLYEMANLYPRTTGLPMTVWVSPRGNAQHDAWVKVNTTHGNRMDLSNAAVVGIRPTPHMVAGKLDTSDFAAVRAWIALNFQALMDYWDGSIDTIELGARLVKVLRL
jgi:hypothetical protein